MHTKIRVVLSILTCALIAYSATIPTVLFGEQNASDALNKKREKTQLELAAALTKKDVATLKMIKIQFARLVAEPLDLGAAETPNARLGIFLEGIQTLSNARDPKFSLAENPLINILPPRGSGGEVYDSGISPDAIKDPTVREQYKRSLENNRLKSEQIEFQSFIDSSVKDMIQYLADFHGKYFSISVVDRADVLRVLETKITDQTLRAELRAKLAGEDEQHKN